MVDSDYCIHYIDVGAKGRGSDGSIFQNSALYTVLETDAIPPNAIIIGDAFPLKKYLMKSYSWCNLSDKERIYNYRLSRARRVVENVFGILASKFRVFEKPISLKLETVDKVACTCCALHNWLRKTNPCYIFNILIDYEDENHHVFPDLWRQFRNNGLQNLLPTCNRHANFETEQTGKDTVIISMIKEQY